MKHTRDKVTLRSGASSYSLQSALDSYVRYYASGSTHTARAKRLDLNHFLIFLKDFKGYSNKTKLLLSDWDFSSMQHFMDACLSKGEAPATVARRLATLKHMGRTLAEKIRGFVNPTKEIKPPKPRALRPQALTKREIRSIQKLANERMQEKHSFIRFRNRTVFNFLIDTGLRADEVRLLRISQIDEALEWIKNVRTKGRRYRNVYITSAMRPELLEYLKARTEELKRFFPNLNKQQDRALPLFISTYGASPLKPDSFLMGTKTLWRAVRELSSAKPLHPHLLRHSYALDLLDNSNDVRLVAQALGHSDVRTTMRYTERKDEEIARALEKSRKKP